MVDPASGQERKCAESSFHRVQNLEMTLKKAC